MKISEHLDLSELVNSNTAKRNGIDNTPSEGVIANLKELAEHIFEPIRNDFKCPIYISSGYRSIKLNEMIGGDGKSQHCKGYAIDIDMDNSGSGVTNKMIFDHIKTNLDFDQLIWEFGNSSNPGWVHVSYVKGKNRKQILRGKKENGDTIYDPIH